MNDYLSLKEEKDKVQTINAYILAGGKSSRMGREKGLIELNGKSFVGRISDTLRKLSMEPAIISNSKLYEGMGLTVLHDIIPSQGPLSGIHAGLTYSKTPYNLFLSCDIPFVNTELIGHLINAVDSKAEIILPAVHGKIEPLCAVYHKTCASKIAQRLSEGKRGVKDALLLFKTKITEISQLPFYSAELLLNINDAQELEAARKFT